MEAKSDDGANAINATSKPRGTYLDPLKACALSGESGVNIGKSESATYSKYMNIVRQTRRTASRVSVLNDVERSRLSNVMKRIDGERAYSTAVMDRQKRQFKKSLENLDHRRNRLLRQIDESVTTPAHLRAKQNLLFTRRHAIKTVNQGVVMEIQEAANDTGNSVPQLMSKHEDRSAVTEFPRLASFENTEPKGQNIPVFYTGIGTGKLKENICMVHTKDDARKFQPVTDD